MNHAASALHRRDLGDQAKYSQRSDETWATGSFGKSKGEKKPVNALSGHKF